MIKLIKNKIKERVESCEPNARSKLMDAAIELFAERGFDGTSTRDIAARSQLNVSLICYYFEGKDGLYKAILEEHAKYAMNKMEQLSSQVDPTQKESFCLFMKNFINLFIEDKLENPNLTRIFEREKVQAFSKSMAQFEEIIINIPKNFGVVIRKAQAAGIVKKEIHPETHFSLLIESVSGLLSVSAADCKLSQMVLKMPKDKEKLKKLIYLIFVEGILL